MKIDKYALVKIYLNSAIDSLLSTGSIIIEVYIVEDFKVNILIRNDTLKP